MNYVPSLSFDPRLVDLIAALPLEAGVIEVLHKAGADAHEGLEAEVRSDLLERLAARSEDDLGLPANLLGRLDVLEVLRLRQIKAMVARAIQAKDLVEVGDAFLVLDPERVERLLPYFDAALTPAGKVEYFRPESFLPVDDAPTSQLLATNSPDAPQEEREQRVVDELTERLLEVLDDLALRDPEYFQFVLKLQKTQPQIAGFALGRHARPRSRPPGPTVQLATRVVTVRALMYLTRLDLRDALGIWNAWYPTFDIDDADRYRRQLLKSAPYLRRAGLVRATRYTPLTDAELSVSHEAWEEAIRQAGAKPLLSKVRDIRALSAPASASDTDLSDPKPS